MEIRSLETFTKHDVSDYYANYPAPVSVVRVQTETGKKGIGQISPYNADVSAKVFHRQVAPHVLGRDPTRIEDIVQDVLESEYKFPGSYVNRALAGLDTALWDLKAKQAGISVCEALGGTRDRLRPYASSMRRDIDPEKEAERLAALRDEHGFDAFKIRIGSWESKGEDRDQWPGRTEAVVSEVREALGPDVDLLVDANSTYTPEKAIQIGKEVLAPNGVVHYEEPCPYWELDWTTEVRETLDVPVAGGEQDNDLSQWKRIIDRPVVDVVQPDVCYMGGITRTRKVAEMAAEAGLPVVPHSANTSLVTVFTMHLLGAIDNAGPYFELTIEDDWATEMLEYDFPVKDGSLVVPDGPGWGVEIDPEWLSTSEYRRSERS